MAKRKKLEADDWRHDPREYAYSAESIITVYNRPKMLADRKARIEKQQEENHNRTRP